MKLTEAPKAKRRKSMRGLTAKYMLPAHGFVLQPKEKAALKTYFDGVLQGDRAELLRRADAAINYAMGR